VLTWRRALKAKKKEFAGEAGFESCRSSKSILCVTSRRDIAAARNPTVLCNNRQGGCAATRHAGTTVACSHISSPAYCTAHLSHDVSSIINTAYRSGSGSALSHGISSGQVPANIAAWYKLFPGSAPLRDSDLPRSWSRYLLYTLLSGDVILASSWFS
jgi:hypothetical protein